MKQTLFRLISCIVLTATMSTVAPAQLAEKLQPLLEAHDGEVAVFVKNFKTGETGATGESFAYRADEPQSTASLIKLPVMVAAYRLAEAKQVDLNKVLELRAEDQVPGSGILTEHFSPGLQLSLQDTIRLMIRYSDNTATNLVIDQLGLPATTEAMDRLGFPHTQLNSKVYRRDSSLDVSRSEQFGLGSTTAREMVELLEQLYRGKLCGPQRTQAMLEHLLSCEDDSLLARQLPETIRFAHKTGAISNARTDAGILISPQGVVGICVLTANNRDQSWGTDNAAHRLCQQIGKIVAEHYRLGVVDEEDEDVRVLRRGASGQSVKLLQRTLNARLTPSPRLSVDGEFGPATEAAVRRFQSDNQFTENGVVDEAVWDALGDLVPASPVPAPEAVNAEALPQQPADRLSGPPIVTCRAWLVMDAATGRIVGQNAQQIPLDMASTTKIMTAWLVLKLAQDEPGVLDEELIFSKSAAATRGSSCQLEAGERLSIREALYGLLLPSGNDMSVALAEHFGARLAPVDSEQAESHSSATTDPLAQFVQAMNDEASRLGLEQTEFHNPHGLTAADHQSTALDLARLTQVAWSDPRFRQYVSTRRRGAEVLGASGYRRNVVWQNTNRLLEIEGYLGVKTGTTTRAGACLVSIARREDRELIAVVLGSAASASRYADTRNLFRWAWQQAPVD